jgi:hypothetical protein
LFSAPQQLLGQPVAYGRAVVQAACPVEVFVDADAPLETERFKCWVDKDSNPGRVGQP